MLPASSVVNAPASWPDCWTLHACSTWAADAEGRANPRRVRLIAVRQASGTAFRGRHELAGSRCMGVVYLKMRCNSTRRICILEDSDTRARGVSPHHSTTRVLTRQVGHTVRSVPKA